MDDVTLSVQFLYTVNVKNIQLSRAHPKKFVRPRWLILVCFSLGQFLVPFKECSPVTNLRARLSSGYRKLFPPLLRLAGWRGGSSRLVLCCVPPAGLGGGEPWLVLLSVSPTRRRPAMWQLLPGLPPEVSLRGVQAQRRRIPLAVHRLQGGGSRLQMFTYTSFRAATSRITSTITMHYYTILFVFQSQYINRLCEHQRNQWGRKKDLFSPLLFFCCMHLSNSSS